MDDLTRINTNIAALQTYKVLQGINSKIINISERISTGQNYNRASDGPASYYMSRKLSQQVRNLNTETAGIERGISWLEDNDSNYALAIDILTEMSDLIESAKAGGITSSEKQAVQTQLLELRSEIGDILQSGIDSKLTSATGFSIGSMSDLKLTGASNSNNPTYAVVVGSDLADITVTGSDALITSAGTQVAVAMERFQQAENKLGSWIKRLTYQAERKSIESLNTSAILSSINDADIAREQMELTKLAILQSTTQSMLSQIQMYPQMVLRLLK